MMVRLWPATWHLLKGMSPMSLMTFKVSVPDGLEAELLEHFVRNLGYVDTIKNSTGKTVSNPESVLDAANRMIAEYILGNYKAHKLHQAAQIAKESANVAIAGVTIVRA